MNKERADTIFLTVIVCFVVFAIVVVVVDGVVCSRRQRAVLDLSKKESLSRSVDEFLSKENYSPMRLFTCKELKTAIVQFVGESESNK